MAGRALTILRIGSLGSRALPLPWLNAVVERATGRIGPRLMRGKADQLQRHIARVLPEADLHELEAATRRGFASYGRYWSETFRLPHLTSRQVDRGFSFVGYDKIEAVRAAGYGPILVLPHLGGWEWAAAWLGRVAKVEVTAVVEKLEPPEVFDWFARLRRSYGVNVIALGPEAMGKLSSAAKRRDIICLLSDRDISGTGMEADFFGETTTVPVGPALLARRTGAPLLPTAVFFRGRQRICMVGDPIWPDGSHVNAVATETGEAQASDSKRRAGRRRHEALINLSVTGLEQLIAAAPDQWHVLEPNWPSDREQLDRLDR